MSTTLNIDTTKLQKLQGFLQSRPAENTLAYCVITFGCQMNYADSEKVQMILTQAGMRKVDSWKDADVVILNTCSVRQKAEDRVFGVIREVHNLNKHRTQPIKVGITGCMTRKTGVHKKYYEYTGRKNTTKITRVVHSDGGGGIFNCDDQLFLRSDNIDFVFRIEET